MKRVIKQRVVISLILCLSGSSVSLAQYDELALAREHAILLAMNAAQEEMRVASVTVEEPQIIEEQVVQAPAVVAVPRRNQLPEDLRQSWSDPNPRVRLSGLVRTSMGIESDGSAVFTRANFDLNERNFRVLSKTQLNRGINTFDPALYSRVKLVVDAAVAAAVDMHLNISIDPWSYVGKTKEKIVTGSFGDTLKAQYLFWGNTGYTVNRILLTRQLGDGLAVPEIKVKHNTVPATRLTSRFGDTFDVPEMGIDYTFWPLREAWVDIKAESNTTLRIFPMGYEDQALSSDDPLKLSNNKTWWEESPWLRSWSAGNYNSGPGDFTKGEWDRSLSFFTRDSNGQRLTALRGATVTVDPDGETSLRATIATPKTLWQDYDEVTAVPASVRVKHYFGDRAYIGTVTNAHQGFVNSHRDAENYVGGVDAGFVPVEGIKAAGQYSVSKSRYDEKTSAYTTKKSGQAYYASLTATNDPSDIIKKDYYSLSSVTKEDNFYRTRVFMGKMDTNFESTLSNYHETRDDAFWSRHLTFYPSTYRHMPGTKPAQGESDLEPFAIGDGLDYGRQSVGWRGDASVLEGKVKGMADLRHVTTSKNHNVETVARTQWTFTPVDRWTTKALFVWQGMPKTVAGIDPFIVDGSTAEPLANTAVIGGEDPSLKTGSLGSRYELTPWAAFNGVWEYTNDQTVGADNFPRGILNDSSFTTYTQDGKTFRKSYPFLYSQGYFDQAPYEYHNIFKTGLELTPTEFWHIYLDYTRNPNKFAGNIDDNINHFGVETSLMPNERLGFFARYTFSKWHDLGRLVNDGVLDYRSYNNVFFETRYLFAPDSTLSVQYGVGPGYNVETSSTNPALTYYGSTVLETQHIIRLICEKKF